MIAYIYIYIYIRISKSICMHIRQKHTHYFRVDYIQVETYKLHAESFLLRLTISLSLYQTVFRRPPFFAGYNGLQDLSNLIFLYSVVETYHT